MSNMNFRQTHYFCSYCKNNTDEECIFNDTECCCHCEWCDACDGCKHQLDIPYDECPCKCDNCEWTKGTD